MAIIKIQKKILSEIKNVLSSNIYEPKIENLSQEIIKTINTDNSEDNNLIKKLLYKYNILNLSRLSVIFEYNENSLSEIFSAGKKTNVSTIKAFIIETKMKDSASISKNKIIFSNKEFSLFSNLFSIKNKQYILASLSSSQYSKLNIFEKFSSQVSNAISKIKNEDLFFNYQKTIMELIIQKSSGKLYKSIYTVTIENIGDAGKTNNYNSNEVKSNHVIHKIQKQYGNENYTYQITNDKFIILSTEEKKETHKMKKHLLFEGFSIPYNISHINLGETNKKELKDSLEVFYNK